MQELLRVADLIYVYRQNIAAHKMETVSHGIDQIEVIEHTQDVGSQ